MRLSPPIRSAFNVVTVLFVLVGVLVLVMGHASKGLAVEAEAEEIDGEPIFVKWSTGFDFSRGDYGLDEDSTLYYLPLGATFDYRRFRVKIVLPFLVSSGPTQIESGGSVTESGTKSGLGQIQMGASYLIPPSLEWLPYLELGGRVTAPTESQRDLGTGLWAFALQADLFRSIGRVTPFLSGGRKFYSACSCNRSLKHRFYASAGASFSLTDTASLGIAYDWLEATAAEADDSHEIVPYASFQLNSKWSFGPYAVIGLSEGSPDFGVGFSVSVLP